MTLEQLSGIFRFAHTTAAFHIDDPNVMWRYMTGVLRPDTTTTYSGNIASPLFRTILRILGSTLWARPELRRPNHHEVECLRRMLFESDPLPLTFAWLQHCVVRARSTSGDIMEGGMVSILAQALGVRVDRYTALTFMLIDANSLRLGNIITRGHDRQTWVHPTSRLPIREDLMDLHHVRDWYETWTGHPYPAGISPADDPALRRREPWYYHNDEPVDMEQSAEEESSDDEDQQGDDVDAQQDHQASPLPGPYFPDEDGLAAQLSRLELRMDQGFARMDDRFLGVYERLDEMNNRQREFVRRFEEMWRYQGGPSQAGPSTSQDPPQDPPPGGWLQLPPPTGWPSD